MNSWIKPGLGLLSATSIGLGTLFIVPARSVELADGTVYFEQPPSLLDTGTSRTTAFVPRATYYFTISIPDNAGEPLQQVEVNVRNGGGSARQIIFKTDETFAFEGTRRDRGDEISVANTTYDEATQTAVVTFTPPVPAGTTVTIGLRPERNPRSGGIYMFGVTAFPPGNPAHGQFLGIGRIQIDDAHDCVLCD